MKRKGKYPLSQTIKPLLIVLSGLSGAGKDAVLKRMKESGYIFEHITTATTRPKRANEKDTDYNFISKEEFHKMMAHNELLEWARVYDNYYGVPSKQVRQALERGQDAVIKVDVQGAATIKKILPQAVFIFLTTPTIEEAVSRLKGRGTESPEDLALRTKTAEEEIRRLPFFDYIVLNRQDEIDQAATDINAIIRAEKCRVTPREITL